MKPTTRADFWPSLLLLFALLGPLLPAAELPMVGGPAPDFALQSLDGASSRLSDLNKSATVVLVVLRGWPGYQCAVCDRQVNEFIHAAPAFRAAGARVVFVYPGPAEELRAHATEFQTFKGRQWPAEFRYLLDPDYRMINAYGLRWDAPRETAYPSTFVLDPGGTVRFAKVSRSHGGRASAAEVLAALK